MADHVRHGQRQHSPVALSLWESASSTCASLALEVPVHMRFRGVAPRYGRRIGILSTEEGRFVAGKRENVRWLSGDETLQGRHGRLEPGRFSLQRVRLYAY
jgi:hypothetical protein